MTFLMCLEENGWICFTLTLRGKRTHLGIIYLLSTIHNIDFMGFMFVQTGIWMCVCVCMCVLTGMRLGMGWMFASTYWARPIDEQLSFITATCQPLTLSPAFANALFPYLLPFLQLSRFSLMSFNDQHWGCHSVSPPSAYRFTDLCPTMDKRLHANFSVFLPSQSPLSLWLAV